MLPADDELRALLRETAQQELLPRFARVERAHKRDGSIVTEADLATQQSLIRALRQRWPTIPLLGEEMSDAEQQQLLQQEDELWLLDPLDGTSNFAAGIPYFSISLALIRHGRVEWGMIYDPLRDECFSAVQGAGARFNGEALHAPINSGPLSSSMGLIDFKRLPAHLAARLAASPPYSSQRSFGSGALDWCMIASGRCQLYLHGGQKLWDYAAGQLILNEAGGRSATLNGEAVLPLVPGTGPRSVVAACSAELMTDWQGTLRAMCNDD